MINMILNLLGAFFLEYSHSHTQKGHKYYSPTLCYYSPTLRHHSVSVFLFF